MASSPKLNQHLGVEFHFSLVLRLLSFLFWAFDKFLHTISSQLHLFSCPHTRQITTGHRVGPTSWPWYQNSDLPASKLAITTDMSSNFLNKLVLFHYGAHSSTCDLSSQILLITNPSIVKGGFAQSNVSGIHLAMKASLTSRLSGPQCLSHCRLPLKANESSLGCTFICLTTSAWISGLNWYSSLRHSPTWPLPEVWQHHALELAVCNTCVGAKWGISPSIFFKFCWWSLPFDPARCLPFSRPCDPPPPQALRKDMVSTACRQATGTSRLHLRSNSCNVTKI